MSIVLPPESAIFDFGDLKIQCFLAAMLSFAGDDDPNDTAWKEVIDHCFWNDLTTPIRYCVLTDWKKGCVASYLRSPALRGPIEKFWICCSYGKDADKYFFNIHLLPRRQFFFFFLL